MDNVAEMNTGDRKKYEVEVIQDSEIYAMELENHLPLSFYYLVSWKGYSKKKKYLEDYISDTTPLEANQDLL